MPEVAIASNAGSPETEFLEIEDLDQVGWNDFASERGWTDGMPVIAPTADLVAQFLERCRNDDRPFRPLTPRLAVPTLTSLATNAIMAGCKPEYFPTVVAAVRAISTPDYNLHGSLATTHPCAITLIVSGPVRHQLGVNFGTNCFGQGWRANAAIGRAVGLIVRNIGGGVPGETDRATHGSPAKYSFCFGENEEESPWAPYRVRRGFSAEDSVVTAVSTEPPHNINDHGSKDGASILITVASVMCQSGSNSMYNDGPTLVVFSPEHAATLHNDGWTIEAMQKRIFDLAWIPVEKVSPGCRQYLADNGRIIENNAYRIAPEPADIHIIVAGGAGRHSAWIPSYGRTDLVCEAIR